ncbi:uncharacterized protein RAG0_02682 [Rhynchosporium agropyri]|uniref:Uncharacterized protein n=1 Tax=Rhynchosporium agropyri TaxID=914238 RepID=A0A1E1K2W2_9HELO|nr:uncharacterized protein RAG0_02682 [Rhynchosporium agropyri]
MKDGVGDASQYIKYPEETEAYGHEGQDGYGHFIKNA